MEKKICSHFETLMSKDQSRVREPGPQLRVWLFMYLQFFWAVYTEDFDEILVQNMDRSRFSVWLCLENGDGDTQGKHQEKTKTGGARHG